MSLPLIILIIFGAFSVFGLLAAIFGRPVFKSALLGVFFWGFLVGVASLILALKLLPALIGAFVIAAIVSTFLVARKESLPDAETAKRNKQKAFRAAYARPRAKTQETPEPRKKIRVSIPTDKEGP